MRCAYRDGREHVGLTVASGKFHIFFPYSRKPAHTYAPCDSASAAAAAILLLLFIMVALLLVGVSELE